MKKIHIIILSSSLTIANFRPVETGFKTKEIPQKKITLFKLREREIKLTKINIYGANNFGVQLLI